MSEPIKPKKSGAKTTGIISKAGSMSSGALNSLIQKIPGIKLKNHEAPHQRSVIIYL